MTYSFHKRLKCSLFNALNRRKTWINRDIHPF